MRALTFLVLSVLLAGCYAEDLPRAPERPAYVVEGAFVEAATAAHARDLEARVAPWDARLEVRETYPMTYRIEVGSGPDCDAVRGMLDRRDYIESVGRCQAIAGR